MTGRCPEPILDSLALREAAFTAYRQYLNREVPFEVALNAAVHAAERPDNMAIQPWERLGRLAVIQLDQPHYVVRKAGRISMDVLYTIDTTGDVTALHDAVRRDAFHLGHAIDPLLIERPMGLDIDYAPEAMPLLNHLRSGYEIAVLSLLELRPEFTPSDGQPNLP
ncbi:MAG TPA: hypothetical protein VD735_01345 [Candidatus Saccharimonadales bacterium]|nr:hypothetical protein [Candidatus Saccharimonadales bacterium]